MRSVLTLHALLLLVLSFLLVGQADAQNCATYSFPYTIGQTSTTPITDLVFAINCANATTTPDVINLNGLTLTYVEANNTTEGGNALPVINHTLTIENGTIERADNLTTCAGNGTNPQEFRFFLVPDGATLVLNQVTLINGCATGGLTSGGGAVRVNEGALYFRNSTVRDSYATFGGGLYNTFGNLIIEYSSILDNAGGSSSTGGGIYSSGGNTAIHSSTIARNRAATGSGIYVFSGTIGLVYVTINANVDTFTGVVPDGAFYTRVQALIFNTLMANTSNSLDCYSEVSLTEVSNNLIENSTNCGVPAVTSDLGSLFFFSANNGTEMYYLSSTSPAINSGSSFWRSENSTKIDFNGDGDLTDTIGVDQNYSERTANGGTDIGSHEEGASFIPLVWDVNSNGTVSAVDVLIVINRLGQSATANDRADIDGNGVINTTDAMLVLQNLRATR